MNAKTSKNRKRVIRWDFEGMGYAVHQALRKSCDSDWSSLMWNLVYAIDDNIWGEWAENLVQFMRAKFPKGVTLGDEDAVYEQVLAFIKEQRDNIHKDSAYRCLVIGFSMADKGEIRAITNFCMLACDPVFVK